MECKQCRPALQTELSSKLVVCRIVYKYLGLLKIFVFQNLIIITMPPTRRADSRMEQNLVVASKTLEDALARER